jgi:topoisomerase-4 subunit A
LDFASVAIKGRASKGNLVTKYPIKKIEIKEKGISTGNQLTTDKIKQVNLLESLPYEEPIEVIPEEIERNTSTSEEGTDLTDYNITLEDDGQITLSLD